MAYDDLVRHQCPQCGREWLAARDSTFTCDHCRMTVLFAQLPPDVIAEADQKIFERKALAAVILYKEAISTGLADARDLYGWRSYYLHQHFPEKFVQE